MLYSKLDVKFLKTKSALPLAACLTPGPMESELSVCSLTTNADYFSNKPLPILPSLDTNIVCVCGGGIYIWRGCWQRWPLFF